MKEITKRFEKIIRLLPLAALVPVFVAVFMLMYNASEIPSQVIYSENSVWDMRGFDFENYNARLGGYFEFIPALLTPEEFAERADEAALGDLRGYRYLTSRLNIVAPDDGWYTFSSQSMRASHRVYVNGEFLQEIGRPGNNREEEIPQIGRITFTTRPVDGVIEIVQQSSNHVHSRADNRTWAMGTGGALNDETRNIDFRQSILMGSFLMLFMIFLLFYYFLRGNRGPLYAALLSLAWFFRMGYIQGNVFTVFMPWLTWEAKFRLEYIGIAVAVALIPSIIATLFPTLLHKLSLRIVYIVVTGFVALYLFADTVLMSQAITISYVFYAPMAVYLFVRMVMKVRNINIGQGIFLIGAVIFILSILLDMFYFTLRGVLPFLTPPIQLGGIAMLIFTLCVATAVFIDTMREVETAKEAERKLKTAEETSRAKSNFLATMSHEIRTPMNAIIGVSEIGLEQDYPMEALDSLNQINNSGKMLLGIINDILDLSKVESGKLELTPLKYGTASLINDTARLNIMRIGDKPLAFVVKVAETLPAYLVGDEIRIKQILNNMLSNAIKYTDKGSVTFGVDSRVDDNGVMLIFTIRDTGQGMTKEQLAALYDEYTMFNNEANRETEGTGLGMSITKNLVELMNGKIEAQSEPGVGSEFKVYLLQQAADGEVLGRERAESLEGFKFTGSMRRAKIVREYMPYGKVLVVDDVDANIVVAKGLMKPYGLAIETAASGYEVLDLIRDGNSYDVIFMDHMMPRMDGVETTRHLREMGYTGTIIALTANAIVGQREILLEDGFNDFVSKPIDTRQLDAVLNEWIRDKQPPRVIEEARRQKERSEDTPTGGNSESANGSQSELADSPLTLLKRINSLEVDSALEAVSGLTDVYVDTVKMTVRRLPETIDKIDSHMEAGNIEDFTVEIHGLKSVLRNIGAAELGDKASQLERAGIEKNVDYCKEHYPPFKAALTEMADRLKAALPKKNVKVAEDKSSLVHALTEAKTATENFDRNAALEVLSPCAEFTYDEETDGLLNEIIYALEAFDCEGAVVKIIQLEGCAHAEVLS